MTAKNVLYDWAGVNLWLFHLINQRGPSWLDPVMSFATLIGDYRNFPVVLVIVIVVAWSRRRAGDCEQARTMRSIALRLGIAGIIGTLMIVSLKWWLDLPRPVAVLGAKGVRLLGNGELRHGFPSGHAAFASLVVVTWWPVLALPLRFALAAFVLLVGISRVWLGQHFPADVLAGYVMGLISVAIASRITELQTRRPSIRS